MMQRISGKINMHMSKINALIKECIPHIQVEDVCILE